MDKKETKFIWCIDWKEQIVKSVKTHCSNCNKALALAEDNEKFVADQNFLPICGDCLLKVTQKYKETIMGGSIVGGKLYKNPEEAIEKADEQFLTKTKVTEGSRNDNFSDEY